MTDVEKYRTHLGECAACGIIGDDLCPEGLELIYECREDLEGDEQQFARRALYREQLKREAEENFRYYDDSQESSL